jgi:hypothetical protein
MGKKLNNRTNNENVKAAEDQKLNSSTKPFSYNEKAQYNKNRSHDKMSLDNDGGNSLKKDTDNFVSETDKLKLYTKNGKDDVLLQEDTELHKFDASPDGGLEYTLPADMFAGQKSTPSEGEMAGDNFEVPTQMPDAARKTTVAMDMDDEMDMDDIEMEGDMDMEDDMEDDMDMENDMDSDYDMDEDMGMEDGMDDDMGEEFDGDYKTPDEVLDCINNFDDEDLEAFLSGLRAWAEENDVDLMGGYDDSRDSFASTLGPDFDIEAAENMVGDLLESRGVSDEDMSEMTLAQGIKLWTKIAADEAEAAKIEVEPEDEDEVKMAENDEKEASDEEEETTASVNFELQSERMATAYEIWAGLAAAGVCDTDEIRDNVENWMESGMNVQAMRAQGNLMRKVASSGQAKKSNRTAGTSNVQFGGSISTSPAFSGGNQQTSGVEDLNETLSSLRWNTGIPDEN